MRVLPGLTCTSAHMRPSGSSGGQAAEARLDEKRKRAVDEMAKLDAGQATRCMKSAGTGQANTTTADGPRAAARQTLAVRAILERAPPAVRPRTLRRAQRRRRMDFWRFEGALHSAGHDAAPSQASVPPPTLRSGRGGVSVIDDDRPKVHIAGRARYQGQPVQAQRSGSAKAVSVHTATRTRTQALATPGARRCHRTPLRRARAGTGTTRSLCLWPVAAMRPRPIPTAAGRAVRVSWPTAGASCGRLADCTSSLCAVWASGCPAVCRRGRGHGAGAGAGGAGAARFDVPVLACGARVVVLISDLATWRLAGVAAAVRCSLLAARCPPAAARRRPAVITIIVRRLSRRRPRPPLTGLAARPRTPARSAAASIQRSLQRAERRPLHARRARQRCRSAPLHACALPFALRAAEGVRAPGRLQAIGHSGSRGFAPSMPCPCPAAGLDTGPLYG
ncbi:hypothetical protein BDV95DRAFT_593528 [Massariosphaeria phaeospora]|uniref:Uncharacterized protein n=1 Tax=Massariosphaeria phaeospora TaxID=100035 RepID=A0A7C8MC26_9PLEO|nr:hypothetical protein BDV95DRAFT_593528 [Massariosphaeria phaeospora]